MNRKYLHLGLISFLMLNCHATDRWHEQLMVRTSEPVGQIEVGGSFVGVEMHNSAPMPNRISFYYPVANSIDLSTDYWKRHESRAMFLGMRIDDEPKQAIGTKPYSVELTPYSAVFSWEEAGTSIVVSYDFCKTEPAMVLHMSIENQTDRTRHYEIYSQLMMTLRTCHTYARIDSARMWVDDRALEIHAGFDDPEAGRAKIFVANAGAMPQMAILRSDSAEVSSNWWICDGEAPEANQNAVIQNPCAGFLYRKSLSRGEKMNIIQLIGSCRAEDPVRVVEHFRDDIEDFRDDVLQYAFGGSELYTGDERIDHTSHWARSILKTNAHYIDGTVVPMPCPAEYNFYFTHDALMTDLSAVNFDISRVKNDLFFIADHAAADSVIPHAYYWKDDRYVTEYATPDNWNHFWFMLLSARYLRHSNDLNLLNRLYPLIRKSLSETMKNLQEDRLMYAYRPDWWDIGRNFGPRSYMTILAIRALQEFNYIAFTLKEDTSLLAGYEKLADEMTQQLLNKLWVDESGYLMNFYEGGQLDPHFYIGSLLAAHFGLLDDERLVRMIETADRKLLDPAVGIYTVFPMDFEQLIGFLHFSGNEAGDPYLYINGGIWPHGNAWYSLALMAADRNAEALSFIKRTMTLDGIMEGPNGQPAMYEYRNGNIHDSTRYGGVDKPQFLWAAGWYLYTMYNLLGVRENVWNLAYDPFIAEDRGRSQLTLYAYGHRLLIDIEGHGKWLKCIRYDGMDYPSAVLPTELSGVKRVRFQLGKPEKPYISETEAVLRHCEYSPVKRSLHCELEAFPGHRNRTRIISPFKPVSFTVNGTPLNQGWRVLYEQGMFRIEAEFIHPSNSTTMTMYFEK